MKEFLYPFSLAYGLLSILDRRRARPRKLDRPVISVGNVTWGGTGKTPLVIKLAGEILRLGKRPAILSRGYRRKVKTGRAMIVSNGKEILAKPEECGDEPYLMAERLPGALVAVGPDRYEAARALGPFSPDVYILDDGFQHWALERDLDIVCVNAANPFGNGLMIPAGILRESPGALGRAQLIVLTRTEMLGDEELGSLEDALARCTEAPVIRSRYARPKLRKLSDGTVRDIGEFSGQKAFAFCALGDSRGFTALLERHGIMLDGKLDFRDHHWYNKNDIGSVFSRYKGSYPVITTAKDAVKLSAILPSLGAPDLDRLYVLDIELEFTTGAEIWEQRVRETLRSSLTATERL